jgi:hypothetical protein
MGSKVVIDAPPCRTVACIGGTAIQMFREGGLAEFFKDYSVFNGIYVFVPENVTPAAKAAQLLNLTDEQQELLFSVSNWPLDLHNKYMNACLVESAQEKVEAACELIDRLIAGTATMPPMSRDWISRVEAQQRLEELFDSQMACEPVEKEEEVLV